MKGFAIYVKNDLLDPKHVGQMGEAVWLYMWLLDKMTTVNENGSGKVLGNKPIQHKDIQPDLGIPRRTYVRWIDKLRDAGYINTLRTPHGLIVSINKAVKARESHAPKKAQQSKSDAPHLHSDVPKSDSDVPKSHIQYKTNQDYTKTNQVSTNVDTGKPVYGDPQVNDLFDHWEKLVGYRIKTQVKSNRASAKILINMYGFEDVKRMIGGVAYSHGQRFAPTITDFNELKEKWVKLDVWGKKHKLEVQKGRTYKV